MPSNQTPGTRPEEVLAHIVGTISFGPLRFHVDLTVTVPDFPGPAVNLNLRASAPQEQE